MLARIELEQMEFHAFHGVYPEEKAHGGKFSVDVSFNYDASAAIESDVLKDALDYSIVFELVKAEMAIPSDLIEHVAGRIVRSIQSRFPSLSNLNVRLCKLNPPVGGNLKGICVELHA